MKIEIKPVDGGMDILFEIASPRPRIFCDSLEKVQVALYIAAKKFWELANSVQCDSEDKEVKP